MIGDAVEQSQSELFLQLCYGAANHSANIIKRRAASAAFPAPTLRTNIVTRQTI